MKKPVLVIMAAGMGSRYGGLKQIDPIDSEGHIMMEFSIYDAIKAGFEKVVFIIKHEIEKDFKEAIGDKLSKHIEVVYVYQEIDNIPTGYKVPEGRVKPWGTGHAILSCKDVIDGPFAVLNADDYYGPTAFKLIYDYLITTEDNDKYKYTMVGYKLDKTLTENGHVSRGICELDANDFLVDIIERTQIEKKENGPAYTEDGTTWISLPENSVASMNIWGFSKSLLKELEMGFVTFLDKNITLNPLKSEYFLPSVIHDLLKQDKANVYVSKTTDQWHGVTYQEDKATVAKAINQLKKDEKYPVMLWAGK
ncbi:MAG TPA: nucleotidyltransferase [Epulopiscium sp.]|nr:nucleotidyltransferase [Candidatus Epulonipiscium sp.]